MSAAVGVAIVMVGQLVASRAIRDGFFLTHFESADGRLLISDASTQHINDVPGFLF